MTFSTAAKVALGEDTCPPFTVWETKEATVQPFFRGNQVCGTPKPWLPPLLPDLGCRLWTLKADATGTLFRMMSPQQTPGTSRTVSLMLTVTLPQDRWNRLTQLHNLPKVPGPVPNLRRQDLIALEGVCTTAVALFHFWTVKEMSE